MATDPPAKNHYRNAGTRKQETRPWTTNPVTLRGHGITPFPRVLSAVPHPHPPTPTAWCATLLPSSLSAAPSEVLSLSGRPSQISSLLKRAGGAGVTGQEGI
ncbi:unnamed protein product [Merluccius merluccius]